MKKVFINLPVADLPRARAFYEGLGFAVNLQFTNDAAACIVISESIHVMLLTHAFFQGFTPLPIADAKASIQMLVALSCESKPEVDAMLAKAVALGGSEPRPVQDHGFMYSRAFADIDGHVWEPFWMDSTATPS